VEKKVGSGWVPEAVEAREARFDKLAARARSLRVPEGEWAAMVLAAMGSYADGHAASDFLEAFLDDYEAGRDWRVHGGGGKHEHKGE